MSVFSQAQLMFFNTLFLNFLMVGLLNTAVGYGIVLLGLWLGLHYSVAIAAATVLGVLFNFKSTGTIVFQSRNNALLMRFVLVDAVIYCLNVAGVAALVRLGLEEWLACLFLLPPLALISFALNRRYVFSS